MKQLVLAVLMLVTIVCLSSQTSQNISLDSELMLSLGEICDIKLIGHKLWLSGSEHMLMCFDLTNPTQPQMLGHYKLADDVYADPQATDYGNLLVLGNYLYFYEQLGQLQVFNIADPANLVWVGTVMNNYAPCRQSIVENSLVYVLEDYGFKIWDYSQPLSPILVSEAVLQHPTSSLELCGTYVYVSYYDSPGTYWLAVVNVSQPALPILANTIQISGFEMERQMNYLYVEDLDASSLAIYSLADPIAPVLAGSVPIPLQSLPYLGTLDLKAAGNWLYIQNTPYLVEENRTINDSYLRFDLSNPAAPVAMPEIPASNFQYGGEFDAYGDIFVANVSYWQADIYLSSATACTKQASLQKDSLICCAKLGNYVLFNSGLALNTNNLSQEPLFLKNTDFFLEKEGFVFSSSFYSIYKWGIDNEGVPALQHQLQIWPPGEYHDYPASYPLNEVGPYVFSNRIYFDINLQNSIQDIDSPLGIGFKMVSSASHGYAISSTGLKIFDLSDPVQPVLVNTMFNNISMQDICLSGNILALAKADIGLYLYDVSIPQSPQLLAFKPNALGIKELKIMDNYLFTSGDHSFCVYNLSNPAQPEQTGFYSDESKEFMDFQLIDHKAYVCQRWQLSVLDFAQAVSNPDIPELPLEKLQLSCYPNPFNAETEIAVQGLKANRPYSVSVYNLKGQKVTTLCGSAQAAQESLNWDARDSEGKSVAAGIYLLRLEQDGLCTAQRVLHLK